MRDGEQPEILRRLSKRLPHMRVLVFSGYENPVLVREMIEAGAHGFVQKSQAARDLILAVERVLAGGTFFGDEPNSQPNDQPGINKSDKPASAAKAP